MQKDATTPVAEIGRKVGLSTTPCWRRIQKMEEDGVIKGRVAVLDPAKINAGVTVFVSVKTNEHNEGWMRKFSAVVEDFTEVVEFYRMSGDVDYLLRVVVRDIAASLRDSGFTRLVLVNFHGGNWILKPTIRQGLRLPTEAHWMPRHCVVMTTLSLQP